MKMQNIQRSQTMNRQNSIRNLIGLACACLVLAVCQTNAADSKTGGHLIVHRIANFGEDLVLTLSVDGAHLADVTENSTYDGYLPPGRHVLIPMAAPGGDDQTPTPLTLTVEEGKTYSYTARWQGSNVVLSKDP
ncbi:MAG: hypothetical protein DME86_02335 [Verrucomicrobia bacterium]|nr:MAG: hypothetical protein DME86_02335 [Verrucomicrobiota bacterium]